MEKEGRSIFSIVAKLDELEEEEEESNKTGRSQLDNDSSSTLVISASSKVVFFSLPLFYISPTDV